MSGLTFIGYIWTIVSAVATLLLIGGIIVPEWLIGNVTVEGKNVIAFFGAYKRCNYPIFDEESSMIALVDECGRYSSLFSVPSIYWRFTIILVLSGSSLSLLLVFLLIPSLCTPYIVNSSTSIILGFFQIVSVVFISSGLVVYPLGWNNPEVRGVCGREADRYTLGECQIGRAFWAMAAGSVLLVVAGILSLCGGRQIYVRDDKRSIISNQPTVPPQHFIRGYDQNGAAVVCVRAV